jgi:NAD(P)-dependent dehydrogenase (short-subunit alcohol dehydrogenase family)
VLGIGRQVAIAFAAEGCPKIAICDLNEAGLAETRQIILGSFSDVLVEPFVLDVANEKSVLEMISGIVKRFGRFDYAVNSAGLSFKNRPLRSRFILAVECMFVSMKYTYLEY